MNAAENKAEAERLLGILGHLAPGTPMDWALVVSGRANAHAILATIPDPKPLPAQMDRGGAPS